MGRVDRPNMGIASLNHPTDRFRESTNEEATMNEEALNTSVRKFLKTLGVTAQREIEKAVREAAANGRLKDSDRLPAKAVVTVGGINLAFEIDGDIELA
jgi:Family of unknown function (DUF6494)